MVSKIARSSLIFFFILLISNINCKKTPTSPELEDITRPRIWVNVSDMSFTATKGGANPSSQTLQVKNSGIGTLSYTISCDIDFVSVSPASGSSTDNVIEHTVSVDIRGISEGNYSGNINISEPSAGNSPLAVSVTVEISSPLADNEISISCDPRSGETGTTVTIPVVINGNINEIRAFGLELTYDTTMFEYQNVSKGDLTTDWGVVDGNEISSGTIRIGVLAAQADPISAGGVGSIVKVTLKVTCSGCINGQQSQICIQNYTDDIAGMTPQPSCAIFTFRK
ncbi:MAG: cohesin domain-containing protein [Thermodesulfobacteriota bacterium]